MSDLLTQLKLEIESDYSGDNERIWELGYDISQLVTESDFMEMFTTLDSVSMTDIQSSRRGCEMCETIIAARAQLTGMAQVNGQPDCNCRWSCGDAPAQCSHRNCNEVLGCGFLWLQSCTGYDSIHPC